MLSLLHEAFKDAKKTLRPDKKGKLHTDEGSQNKAKTLPSRQKKKINNLSKKN